MSTERKDRRGATRRGTPNDHQFELERGLTHWYLKALDDFREEAGRIMNEVVAAAEPAAADTVRSVIRAEVDRSLGDFRKGAGRIMNEVVAAAELAAAGTVRSVIRAEVDRSLRDFREEARRILGEVVAAAEPTRSTAEDEKFVRRLVRAEIRNLGDFREQAGHSVREETGSDAPRPSWWKFWRKFGKKRKSDS